MAAEMMKHMALQGVEGAWHYATLAVSVGRYAAQNPGEAAASGTKKLLHIGLVTPARQIGGGLIGLAALVWEPLPWAGRGIVLGLRFGQDKIVRSFTDRQKVPLYGPVSKLSSRALALREDSLDELKKGLACAFVMAMRLDTTPRTIKINTAMYAAHVGVMVPAKIAKMMLLAAIVHSTPLAHMAIGHLLVGGFEDHILSFLHAGAKGTQIGIGVGMVYVTHATFAKTLVESNLWEKDMEIVGQTREYSLVRKALTDLTKALAALEPLAGSQRQAGQPLYMRRRQLRQLERGLATAKRLGVSIQDPKFADVAQMIEPGDIEYKVAVATRRFDHEKTRDFKLAPVGLGTVAAESTEQIGANRPLQDALKSLGHAFKQSYLFTKPSEKMFSYRLKTLRKAAVRADATYKKRQARWSLLEKMAESKPENQRLQLRVQSAYFDAQVALYRARDAHYLVAKKSDPLGTGAPDPRLSTSAQEKKSLAANAAANHPAMSRSSTFVRLVMRGYTSRRAMYENKSATLQQHALEVSQMAENAPLYAKPQLAARATKIAEKALIAQLRAKQAGLDQAITAMALRKTSEIDADFFRWNREAFLQCGLLIEEATLRYRLAADAEKRTSAYVVPGALPFVGAPGLVNASIKLGWYTLAVFPGTNLPYWGLRYFLCLVSRERYQVALDQALA